MKFVSRLKLIFPVFNHTCTLHAWTVLVLPVHEPVSISFCWIHYLYLVWSWEHMVMCQTTKFST